MKTFLPSFSRYLFCYLLLICFVNGASCSASDVEKLLSFKSKLSNPRLLRNWVSGQDPCTFTGVKCLSGSGISAINIDGVSLSVEFRHVVECLFSVSNLESLSLTRSSLSGSVGVGKAWCSGSLLDLDLSGNALTGSLKDVDQLSICSGLRSLNLSSNLIEFGESATGSFKLRKLQSLDLSFNRLHGADVVSGIVSGGCENLKQLSLNGNKITGEVDVSGCVNLLHLDISSNNFSATFPSLGANCLSLQHLDISSNKFSGEIVDKVVSCTHLRLLNLSGNQFTGSLPTLASTNLDFIYLSNNDFTGSIPSTLADDVCGSVIELDLSGNAFSGTVPASLGSCSVLNFFSIAHNNLTGELPIEVFLKMTKLKKLSVSFNQFTGTLPDSLREIPNLETLDLSSNNISGSVPSKLCNNPSSDNLKELYLQNNLLTGEIPETIGNCSNLVSLDLSFNYLTGKIPTSIGSLSKLKDLIIWFNQLEGEIPQELENLKFLENLILDFNYLTGTIPSGLRKCTNLNWISLSNNRLTGEIPSWIGELNNLAILKLSNNSFHGPVPRELGDCKSLIWVDLNSNFLNGTIPVELFKQSGFIVAGLVSGKRFAYAKRYGSEECHGAGNLMDFAGIREEQLLRLSTRSPCNFTRIYRGIMQPNFNHNGSMIFLDISFNELSGEIPKQIGSMYYLYVLNLGHNDLSGLIPAELGNMRTLNILDLSSNRLQGPIPNTLSSIASLTEVDLSNNMLSGQIPESGQFEVLPASGFLNNSGLCGIPLPKCGANSSTGAGSRQRASRREASLAGSVAMGLLFSLFCVIGFVLLAIETRKRRRMREEAIGIYADSNSHSVTSNWKLTGAVEASSITLAAFDKPLRKLTFGHLLEATNGFHNDSLIGSGGFGDVYKAKLKDGNTVAIKKLIHMSGQGDREFMAEMETIGKIKHRNLVPLLGYCKVGEERLLVYEYMRYGSLDDVLHGRRKGGMRLNWAARRKIGIGAARGLAFLHHSCIPHIIHRDMKSSNVLLDENLEARVSDFGMARFMSVMDTHLSVSTLAGTPGYVPPEYYQSFKCSAKGDVYSFGVVLLELLTGKRPTDSPEFGDNNLVGWVKQHAKLKIRDVFDQELLKADPSVEVELLQHLKVACACLDDRHWKRPTMIQVMAMFKEIQAGSGVVDSGSTISADDGRSFGADMIEMTIKEHP